LLENYREEEIKFWRTSDQKEIDFVITPLTGSPIALEVKFSAANLKKSKYRLFTNAYPDIPLKFVSYNNVTEENEAIQILKV